MIDRSNEIIKQLNRLANDRALNPHARNKIREAVQHIKDLHTAARQIRDAYFKLKDSRSDPVIQNRASEVDEAVAD